MMVGRWVSFWDCLFLGAMLNFRGVTQPLAAGLSLPIFLVTTDSSSETKKHTKKRNDGWLTRWNSKELVFSRGLRFFHLALPLFRTCIELEKNGRNSSPKFRPMSCSGKLLTISSWWLNQPIWKTYYIYSQIGPFPQVGVNLKNVSNHHLDIIQEYRAPKLNWRVFPLKSYPNWTKNRKPKDKVWTFASHCFQGLLKLPVKTSGVFGCFKAMDPSAYPPIFVIFGEC